MNSQIRVISMVPSWTETLIQCEVNVVGRTRFCIHPRSEVKSIPVVGGTKDINWNKVKEIKPDLILFDAEENPKKMADECPFPWLASHIKSVEDVQRDLNIIAERLKNKKLIEVAHRWRNLKTNKKKQLDSIPGIIDWIKPLTPTTDQFIYLIWNNPWMAVSRNTFIGSVFQKLGLESFMLDFETPYPEVKLDQLDPERTLLLFSTEPFPFGKKRDLMKVQGFSSALINGESYSWFGLRALQFLEENVELKNN